MNRANYVNPFDKYVGKDVWVRIRPKYAAARMLQDDEPATPTDADSYIRIIRKYKILYFFNQMSASYVDHGLPSWNGYEYVQAALHNTASSILETARLVEPLDVLTTDELLEALVWKTRNPQ